MFFLKKKKIEKESKKIQLIENTQKVWKKFENLHQRIYSLKSSLKPLLHTTEEIKLQEMPPFRYKYCKNKGTSKLRKILESNIIVISDDAKFIQQSVLTLQERLGHEQKEFQLPILDNHNTLYDKCIQFEPLLTSFEEEIKFIEEKKEMGGQDEIFRNDVSVRYAPKNGENVTDSYNDDIEEMTSLNWRLNIYFQDLFTIENGLNTFENDKFDSKMKEMLPEEPDLLELLVKEKLHFQYIQIRIKTLHGIFERLRNKLRRIQNKVDFTMEEVEKRNCPGFSSENPWKSMNQIFKYIYEEILTLKYDFEQVLDFLDNDD